MTRQLIGRIHMSSSGGIVLPPISAGHQLATQRQRPAVSGLDLARFTNADWLQILCCCNLPSAAATFPVLLHLPCTPALNWSQPCLPFIHFIRFHMLHVENRMEMDDREEMRTLRQTNFSHSLTRASRRAVASAQATHTYGDIPFQQ